MGVVELRNTLQVACLSKEGRHVPAARSRFPGVCARLHPTLQSEKSPRLRHRLLMLAREWMHAAMQQRGAEIHRESTDRMDANSGEPWSEADMSDLKNEIAHGRTATETASFLCRDEDEVREKMKELGLVEQPGKGGKPRASFSSLCAFALLLLGRERIAFRQTESMEPDSFDRMGR